ncbi:MAG: WD40 repeat domain-containing protein, partial [Rivularia sp. ALOHA_DT_140]|nr:WD40 repeat domain-containing protein [Rivularia sp. ALOHA_DT_140]
MALLYFSGYVLVRDEGIKEVFLTTSDSNPSEDYELGVSLRWLKQLLEESLVQQQIIIFDCYYNEEHNLHIDNLIPGYQNNKDRCFLILFNKNIQDFVHKKDERVCSFFTNAIINILKLDEEEGINCVDSKILIKSLKDRYENRLKKNGYYKRISFGKRIHILGEPPDNSKVNSTLTHNQSQRKNPYKGLASFRYEDAEYFYGRQKLTDELLEKVRNKNFLAVMGALGSGKSSAIRAGLIYQITLGNQISGSEGWITIIFQPGMRPFQSLAEALAKALLVDKSQVNDSEFQRTVGETREFISQGSDALQQLIRRANTKRVVLVVDQFEEVFTDCHDHNERENFFECLLGALSKIENNKLCLVLAIRGDYFGRCAEREYYGLARKIQQHLVAVTPMSDSELQEAIEEPANELGVEVDEKLTRKLIKEVKNKLVGLPLLQYYLQKNWNENEKSWQSENSITLIDRVNKSLGRVIEEDANYVYDNLQENERPVARYIFLKLTYLGEGTGDSRKKVYADKLENTWRYQKEDIEAVKQKLIDNQLIIAYKQITDEGIEVEFVNLIHDALISHWSKLRFWLGEYRVYSKLKEDIEEKSKQWKAKKYDISYLYVGKELEETEKLINNYGDIRALKKLANEFIAASKKLRDEKEVKNHQEEQKRIIEQKRINRNNRLTIIGIVILVVFFIVVIIINSLSLERASIEQNKRYLSNQSVALTRYSKTLFNERRQFDALIEGLRAVVPLKKQELPLPNNIKPVLRQAVDGVKERNRLEGHTGSIYNVGFSPDGKILASGSLDKSIKLWNVETGEEILPRLKNHKRKVYNVSFNPQDKTQLASSSADGTIRLWNLETGEYKELIGHKGKVYSLSFTQDGEILASTGLDKTIKLWNAKTGEEIFSPLTGHKGKVYSVSFNPKDKTQLASGSADGTVRLWNISTGESKILIQRN